MTATGGLAAGTMPDASRRGLEAAALVVVALAWLYLAWPWLSGTWTVPWDAKAHFQPQLEFLAGSIAAGESPFWNPYIFAGWPQVADPQSLIFVPAFLLLALFDPAPSFVAMDATVFGALLVGALALALWGRDRGWHPAAGVVAALSFAFGGSAAWRLQHTGQVMSLAVVPVVLFCLARAIERRSAGWGLAAGVSAGVLALGRDQIALLGIYLLAGYAMTLAATGRRPGEGLGRRLAGMIKPGLAAAVGGLAVVVVPVALTLILAGESNRPEIDYIGAGKGSLHPASLITAVISDLFGQRDPDVHYWGPPSAAFKVLDIYLAQNMGAIYAGAVPVAAILFLGLARGALWSAGLRYWTVATLLTIVYAIGWYTPLFKPIFDHVPGVKLYRRPADATFIIGLEIAILGGWLASRWLQGAIPPATAVQRGVAWTLAALTLVVLPVAFGLHADRLAEAAKPTLVAMLWIGGAMLALMLALVLDRRAAVLVVLLLGGYTAADLHFNNAPNESTAYPPETFRALDPKGADPVIEYLKARTRETASGARRDRVELAGLGFHWPNASMVHRLDHTLGYNPLRLKVYQQATGAQDTVGLPDQRLFVPMFPSYSSTMANLLGLRWIAAGVPLAAMDPGYDRGSIVEVATFGDTRIYENRKALPRALFVTGARTADFAGLLATGAWPEGFDPTREVILEAGTPDAVAAPAPAAPVDAKVTITAYHHTEVVVTVDTPQAGWVVLNDVWHRWWRASVDGAPAPILKANAIFRAVRVPAGRHEIRFTFHPFAGALADLGARFGG
ncbi:hypothetical protein [Prosthecomicrobium sp. N25]|uniref:hypothetical protein n=1 Tax=Prosthecomicrobium sp. N25 TaxID=3129254 RepID=UPI0030789A0B